MEGEEEEVESGSPSGKEGPPPPSVVLSTEMEVAEEDRGLGTHHQKNNERQHDETKHVVHLTRPAIFPENEVI